MRRHPAKHARFAAGILAAAGFVATACGLATSSSSQTNTGTTNLDFAARGRQRP